MKKQYVNPMAQCLNLSDEDILTASNPFDVMSNIDEDLVIGWDKLSGTK